MMTWQTSLNNHVNTRSCPPYVRADSDARRLAPRTGTDSVRASHLTCSFAVLAGRRTWGPRTRNEESDAYQSNRGYAPQFHLTPWLHLRAGRHSAIPSEMASWPLRLAKPGGGWDPADPGAGRQPPMPRSRRSSRRRGRPPGHRLALPRRHRGREPRPPLVPDAAPGLISRRMLRRANAGVGASARSRRAWQDGSRGAASSGGPLVPNVADVGNAEPLPVSARAQDVLGVPSAWRP